MESVLRYRGRSVGQQEITFLRELIASRPGVYRPALWAAVRLTLVA
jgi:hypothetical protein